MPPMKNASKKRTRQAGTKGPAKKKQAGSLSLDFVQDLLDESLVANGIVKEDTEDEADDSDAEPDVSGDENEASNITLEDCYEIKELPGKGMGVIASTTIEKGIVIMSEPPLFLLLASTPMPTSSSALDALIASQGLAPETKVAISKLANFYHIASVHPAVGILQTNSLPVTMSVVSDDGEKKDKRAGGLFENVCRLNHSCVPNAKARWERGLGERGEMRVKSLRRVESGEEITISYGVKSAELNWKFGFDCDCEKCRKRLVDGSAEDENVGVWAG